MILVVVVPFLNEERFLPILLDSISDQRRVPDILLLVDDGSRDGSLAIARSFASDHAYASVLVRAARPPEPDRLATAAELRAFTSAVGSIREPWEVVAKLDADIQLSPRTFDSVLDAFGADPRLGIAGPYLSAIDGKERRLRERSPPDHVRGGAKFFRRECYEHISPLPLVLGWDGIDEARARMGGWRTASISVPGGDPLHLRPSGGYDGRVRGFARRGLCAWVFGAHPLNVLLGGISRARERPYVLGGLAYVLGWTAAAARRVPRAEREVRVFVRREQLRRIGAVISAAVRH